MEKGIHDIVQVIAKIAQDPQSNIVIETNKPFWQIVATLNNLRKRLVRLSQEVEESTGEVENVKQALAQLSYYLNHRPEQLASSWQTTGTPVGEVALKIAALLPPSSSTRSTQNKSTLF